MNEIDHLLEPKNNFKNYRDLLISLTPPYLPFEG